MRLDTATQNIILEAAANAEQAGWDGVVEQARMDTQTLIDNGVNVVQPSAELLAELQSIGEVMVEEWLQESPAEIGAILETYNQ